MKEGDDGDDFFMVEEGKLKALKLNEGKEISVKDYGVGDYFGELALLKNCPR